MQAQAKKIQETRDPHTNLNVNFGFILRALPIWDGFQLGRTRVFFVCGVVLYLVGASG